MEYFNLKSGRNLGYDTIESIKAIDKILAAGKPVREFMTITNNQCHWGKDVHPEKFENLFPETIFRPSHWSRYLTNVPAPPKGPKGSKQSPESPNKYEKFYL